MSNIQKTYIIYHGPLCHDGYGAALVAWLKFGDEAVYLATNYGREFDINQLENQHVFVLDYSFDQDKMLKIAEISASICILDHHVTAEADLKPLIDNGVISGVFDMERSGAQITWQYFFPDQPEPPLIKYIADRDLWHNRQPYSKEVFLALSSHPKSFSLWQSWLHNIDSLITDGKPIRRYYEQLIEALEKTAFRTTVGGFEVPAVNASMAFASDLAGRLAEGEAFAVVYCDDGQLRKFSLRSSSTGIDVAEIAKQYGGGGHKHASGFVLPCSKLII